MRGSGRVRVWLGVAVAASVAVLGLAGCGGSGSGAAGTGQQEETSDVSWEAQALEEVGFNAADVSYEVTTDASPSPGADRRDRARAKFRHIRFGFGKRMLHAEAVVQTDEGTKTVVVQRGVITAIDATTVTVKSADGFTISWTFGDPLTVVKRRQKVDKSALAVGLQVGVAGAKQGEATNARLIVVPGA